MFATFLSATLFFSLAIQTAVADFSIDTPQLVQCQNAQVSWDETVAPYNMIVVPGDDPCSYVVSDLGDHNHTSMTWMVNLPAGTNVMFSLEDASGGEAWSGAMTILPSNDSSCLPASSSSAVSSSAAVSTSYSSSAAISSGGTTLYVSPASTHASSAPVASSAGGASAVGAVNAGDGPKESSAFTVRQFSTPLMVFSAVAALAALV